jgi:photosystem II stability/assembly factor-like uncharacterized protein
MLSGASPVLNFFIHTYRTPPFLLPIYLAAAERYDVPWQVLAAVNEVESNYGYDLGVSSAGAEGWMQFLPAEWSVFGVDANGAGVRDPYNPADAIFAAARYLQTAGAAHDLRTAIYAYNHSSSYVESVLLRARLLGETPRSMIGGLAAIVDGRVPVESVGGLTATPVWAKAAAAPRTGAPQPAVVGASIATIPGAPVVAVQNAEVIHIGRNAKLGRFIELRDAYGDLYTYAKLGRVLRRYEPPSPPRPIGLAPPPNAPAARSAGARPARLRKGTWVAPGTVLGDVAGRAPGPPARFLFAVQPAGAGPIDPRPVLDAWRLLGEAQGHPQRGTQPLFGPNARDGLVGEIRLMSKPQLEARLLSDPALRISSCQRWEIAAGHIDRRVLATLDFLIASGLAPRTSALRCNGGRATPANRSKHARADAATISALDGAPFRGHRGTGLLAKLAAGPLASSAPGPGPVLGRSQWPRLIARISRQPQPYVPRRPTSAAVADSPSSPAPAAAPLPASLPLASGASPAPATAGRGGAGSSTRATPGATAGSPGFSAPLADSAASLTPEPEFCDPAAFALAAPGTGNVLTKRVELEVTTGGTTGAPASIEFQYSPATGKAKWTKIASGTSRITFFKTEAREAGAPLTPDGLYDLRALVTDAQGHECAASLPDQLIDNEKSPVLDLEVTPAGNLSGTIALEARPDGAHPTPYPLTAVRFEYADLESPTCRARIEANCWHPIAETAVSSSTGYAAKTSFETFNKTTHTPAVPDGLYAFRVVTIYVIPSQSEEPGESREFASIPVRELLIDNTPPAVSLQDPGSPLHGEVTLSATAVDPSPGSGVVSVTFESATAGSKAWKSLPGGRVMVPSSPSSGTYTHRLSTESLKNGSYDFRASAEDAAGNDATSQETKVEIGNQELASTAPPSVNGVVAPAENITILGAVAAGAGCLHAHEAETWAYGITHAPPAAVNGTPLEYRAQGYQLVLLRYTDQSHSWQIADVLREKGGEKAFELLRADELNINANGGLAVKGAMTPSGEAWLTLVQKSRITQESKIAVFHRPPCGRFEYDEGATNELRPLLGAVSIHLSLGQNAEAQVGGILTAGTQEYALLENGKWTRETTRPSDFGSVEPVALKAADAQGPGEAWGAFTTPAHPWRRGLILGHLYNHEWHLPPSAHLGLDALDLTGALGKQEDRVEPEALKAEPLRTQAGASAVWIEATVDHNPGEVPLGRVVARYEEAAGNQTGKVTSSWCTLRLTATTTVPNECEQPIGSAAVPDAFFATESGPVALSLQRQAVDVYARGRWTSVLAPGHEPEGSAAFTGPTEGWIGGKAALGRWAPEQSANPLTPWPLPDRSPLTSVALMPGSQAAVGESGALAVGLDGATLRYDASTGWQVESPPRRAHHINLLGVAFAGPSSAFAVGQFGVILRWDGTSWSEDPQSISLTQSQLNAVAFASTGEGWAVGANGTILHYDGSRWSIEEPPPADAGANVTSVAVAGSEAFAVVGGNLIRRPPGAGWEDVSQEELPQSPRPTPGRLHLVAGLPDGDVVAVGSSIMLVREGAGRDFEYAEQPLSGVAVALAPFREAGGKLRAYVSVAPPVNAGGETAGFPPGDGELLRQTEGGWQDLSSSQYAGGAIRGDGAVKSDPVLAVATDQTGGHAWAVGGYDGTEDAASRGTNQPLSARSAGWRTASIWRYDGGDSVRPPGLAPSTPSLPANKGVVSFAFFTSPECKVQCSAVPDAQPDVNLSAATKQIAAYAAQPGGPAFAMLGGNAVGPLEHENGAEPPADFARLPELLAPLGGLPTFAAIGRSDQPYETPWSEAFAEAPAPFGTGAPAAGITPVSSGSQTPNGDVHRYYAFDAHQNGATLRVIVLDNSAGALEAGAATEGQLQWLEAQLAGAHGQGLPVVVIASVPLQEATDGEAVASLLASSGVLAVFTTSARRLDERRLIPEHTPGVPKIPEYEGASLGYQKPQNNGVKWYFVSANTQAREVEVAAVPVIASLALKPLDGLSVARSLTLQFEAVGRRPPGTLATIAGRSEEPSEPGEPFPGYDNYVEIPSPSCGKTPCVPPSYAFASSDPTIGEFVEPSGPGSPLPKLDSGGHPIPSSVSGLFCAYNAGTTTVSITTGLLSYSQPVTVKPGGFGSPCGTVYRPGVGEVIRVHTAQTQGSLGSAAAPPPPPPAPLAGSLPASLAPPPVPPPAVPVAPKAPKPPAPAAAKPKPTPAVVAPPLPPPIESVGAPPAILPAATPPIEPIPPGASGYAQSPSAAERKEKARKQASQSAFTIRPAGTSGADWFYVAVGFATLLALLLSARALPGGPRLRPALLLNRRAAANRHAAADRGLPPTRRRRARD